jgi:DNA-binding transcriptional ArsR family regulator
VRDIDCIRRDQEIDRRKALYRQAKALSNALRAVTDRQRGGLTRSSGHVLAIMIRQNLRACVRGELFHRPTRAALAKETGHSERTVSRAITQLTEAGLIVTARYRTGGRLGRTGRGLATEFRSGCLMFLADQLAGLGYRLPKGLHEDLNGMAEWAGRQVGEASEQGADTPRDPVSTGTKCPGTLLTVRKAPPVDRAETPVADVAPGISANALVARADLLRTKKRRQRCATPNALFSCSLQKSTGKIPRDGAMMRQPVQPGSLTAQALAKISRTTGPNKADLARAGAVNRAETLKQNKSDDAPVLSTDDKTEPVQNPAGSYFFALHRTQRPCMSGSFPTKCIRVGVARYFGLCK